jgi:hypothetical protein
MNRTAPEEVEELARYVTPAKPVGSFEYDAAYAGVKVFSAHRVKQIGDWLRANAVKPWSDGYYRFDGVTGVPVPEPEAKP